VVLVILGLLAALAGPQVMKHVGGAKSSTAKLQIEEFGAALDMYKLEVGRYPNSQEGLQALSRRLPVHQLEWPVSQEKDGAQGPLGQRLSAMPHPASMAPFDIYSYGADNREGGEGEDKDIVSWQ
jgi:general secretion pathway protein G